MTCVPTTPESETSDMSNGTNGTNGTNGIESIENLRLDGRFTGNGAGIGIVPSSDPVRVKMARKQSSPMMPAFMVSAPGKVIVFGEHAVVHGKVRPTLRRSLPAHLRCTAFSLLAIGTLLTHSAS